MRHHALPVRTSPIGPGADTSAAYAASTDVTRESTHGPETTTAENERPPDWAARVPFTLPEWMAHSLPVRIVERFIAIQGIDLAFRLAAQAFISLIPLMIVAASVAPIGSGKSFRTTLINVLGLHGAPKSVMQSLAGSGGQVRGGITVISALVLIYSALSFTRTLRRVYERAWNLPKRGLPGLIGDVLWMVSFILYLALMSAAREEITSGFLYAVIALLLSIGFWTWTPAILLAGRERLLLLVPSGAVMIVGMAVLAITSIIYMPNLIVAKFNQFGQVGVVFAILSWMIVCCFVIVAGACISAVLGEWVAGTRTSLESTPPVASR